MGVYKGQRTTTGNRNVEESKTTLTIQGQSNSSNSSTQKMNNGYGILQTASGKVQFPDLLLPVSIIQTWMLL